MINITDKKECAGCSACINICPQNCIHFEADEEGFQYPVVDYEKCVHCNKCDIVCQYKKDTPVKDGPSEVYGMKHKDDSIREISSSGGAFSLFAESVLSKKGVVYGVAMTDDMKRCHHIRIETIEDLPKLYGSKYMQSDIEDCFEKIALDLNSDRLVLFSGTPCQVYGLKLFLGKDFDKLLCIDVICHGVPSQKLWEKYICYVEEKYKTRIKYVNFRHKKNGWRGFGLKVTGNNINMFNSLEKDPYLKIFLRNSALRPSCYNCHVKNLKSMADITIADFWGVYDLAKELSDNKGVSLVLIQTAKGKELFKRICSMSIYQSVDCETAINSNVAYMKSPSRPLERECLYRDLNSMDIRDFISKYGTMTVKEKIKYLIKQTVFFKLYRLLRYGDGE